MKLEHIAFTISDTAEIKNFYHNILGMDEVRNFVLNKALADKIFGIDKETSVFLIQKDNLVLEIFVASCQRNQNFNHICMSIKNREEVFRKAMDKNYKCIRIEREISDLIFIKDKSGNIFEIK